MRRLKQGELYKTASLSRLLPIFEEPTASLRLSRRAGAGPPLTTPRFSPATRELGCAAAGSPRAGQKLAWTGVGALPTCRKTLLARRKRPLTSPKSSRTGEKPVRSLVGGLLTVAGLKLQLRRRCLPRRRTCRAASRRCWQSRRRRRSGRRLCLTRPRTCRTAPRRCQTRPRLCLTTPRLCLTRLRTCLTGPRLCPARTAVVRDKTRVLPADMTELSGRALSRSASDAKRAESTAMIAESAKREGWRGTAAAVCSASGCGTDIGEAPQPRNMEDSRMEESGTRGSVGHYEESRTLSRRRQRTLHPNFR